MPANNGGGGGGGAASTYRNQQRRCVFVEKLMGVTVLEYALDAQHMDVLALLLIRALP